MASRSLEVAAHNCEIAEIESGLAELPQRAFGRTVLETIR
jgi:hypothetical protein